MTNEELSVFSDLIEEVRKVRKSFAETTSEYLRIVKECEEFRTKNENLAFAKKAAEENGKMFEKAAAERDDARRRLKEAVLMLEEMWRDYSHIKWRSKADKARAKEMAAKIKAWSDAKEFHMVQTEKGEWVAK